MGAMLVAVPAACRGESSVTVGPIEVSNAYLAEPVTPDSPVAVYFTVTNRGTEVDTLVGISATFATHGEFHEQVTEGGGTRMRPVDAVELPVGGKVVLAPGGLHGMLLDVSSPPKHSEPVVVALHFWRAGTVDVRFAVVTYANLEEYAGRPR